MSCTTRRLCRPRASAPRTRASAARLNRSARRSSPHESAVGSPQTERSADCGLRTADSCPVIRVAVSGAAGRMGATVCEAVDEASDLELAGRADPALSVPLADVLDRADVVVDFTTPDAAPANVRESVAAGVHAVVGTTGFDLDALRD